MRPFVLFILASFLIACGPSPEDIEELRNNQKQILAKLRDMERKMERAQVARPAKARPQADPDKVHDIPVGDSAVRGPEDARVTIVEFSDYQCPFCARAEPLVDTVLAEYPKDVKLVFKNFPLVSLHPQAMGAAKAAVAAGMQGKYWEMHEKLFQNQRALGPEALEKYAAEIGLDVEKWKNDMNSTEVQAIVNEDMKAAAAAGVRGTPTFFINGKHATKHSESTFKAMIDAALKRSDEAPG